MANVDFSDDVGGSSCSNAVNYAADKVSKWLKLTQ